MDIGSSDGNDKVKKIRPSRMGVCRRVIYWGQDAKSNQANLSKTEHVLSNKSPNAWKSRREENATEKSEEDAKYDNMRREIRGLLNKITPSTYEELSNDFCAYNIYDHPKLLMIPCIDMIFDKVVKEPHFCALYSDLCKKQVDVERQAKEQRDFKDKIIFKCQHTFLLKSTEGMDDKTRRTQIEEELEMIRSTKKRRMIGIIKFIGQLYQHELLVETIIDWCACELIKRYEMTKEELYIEYCVELIETVGKIYEERKQQVLALIARLHQAQQVAYDMNMISVYRLDMVFSHLITKVKPLVSNRVRFAIMNLADLRKNNWNPREVLCSSTLPFGANFIG